MNNKLGKNSVIQNLSSETLFHFTKDFETLEKILNNGFQARYIYEKLPGLKLAYLTKTICFCDIPLGAIKEHISWYGEYGMGLNRQTARDKGFTPAFHIHSNTPNFPKISSSDAAIWFKNFPFTRCLKQIRGKQMFSKNSKYFFKWKTFYNEKEWRYFPEESDIKIIEYQDEKELETERN